MNEWIDIKDKKPEDGQDILMLGYVHGFAKYIDGKIITPTTGSPKMAHWMPLPTPPK